MANLAVVPQLDPVDWLTDPRWGHDDVTAGTLAELHAVCMRRLTEIVGPEGPELVEQLFRFERDSYRYGSLVDDWDDQTWSVPDANGRSLTDGALRRVFGPARSNDEDAQDVIFEQVLMPTSRAGQKAAQAHPWTLRGRSSSLAELVDEPDIEPTYRIGGLWPHGGKVVLSAQAKAGKTTLVANVLRSLADGVPLFDDDRFAVEPMQDNATIYVADFELTRGMLRRQLGEQGINGLHRVHVETYLGRGEAFDVRNPEVRAELAAHLRSIRARVIVVDPIGPVLAALNIDEDSNGAVRRFLAGLDALALEAGSCELLVTHHHGHSGERSRGAAAFRDWPDAEWRLTVARPRGAAEPGPDAPRFLTAAGRDVAVPEQALMFAERRLTLAAGDRQTVAAAEHSDRLGEVVRAEPGISQRGIREQLTGVRNERIPELLRAAMAAAAIHVHPGPNRSQRHFPGPVGGGCEVCPSSVLAPVVQLVPGVSGTAR